MATKVSTKRPNIRGEEVTVYGQITAEGEVAIWVANGPVLGYFPLENFGAKLTSKTLNDFLAAKAAA